MKRSIDRQIHESQCLLRRALQWLEVNHPIGTPDAEKLRELLIQDIQRHFKSVAED